jgi:hypothetical protein
MKTLFPNWQKESWQTFEQTSRYVRPERINKWPNSMKTYDDDDDKRSPDLWVILFTARSVTTSNTANIKEINYGGIYRIQSSDAVQPYTSLTNVSE